MRQKMICGEFASCLNYFVPTRDGILKMPALSALPEEIQFPVVGTFFSFKLVISGRILREESSAILVGITRLFLFYSVLFLFSSPSETSTHSKRFSLHSEHVHWRELALRHEVLGYRFAMWLHLGNAWTLGARFGIYCCVVSHILIYISLTSCYLRDSPQICRTTGKN